MANHSYTSNKLEILSGRIGSSLVEM